MSDTEDRVRALIVEHLRCDAEQVTMEATLHEDLNADSLDDIEIVMSVEQVFNISILDSEVINLTTVGDVVKLVDSKLVPA